LRKRLGHSGRQKEGSGQCIVWDSSELLQEVRSRRNGKLVKTPLQAQKGGAEADSGCGGAPGDCVCGYAPVRWHANGAAGLLVPEQPLTRALVPQQLCEEAGQRRVRNRVGLAVRLGHQN
jgi:hypothetical protein